mgnify:CR=1 FL=1
MIYPPFSATKLTLIKYEQLKELPGIGDYTANILLALIHNKPNIGIDGNVKRVLFRLYNLSDWKKNITKFQLKQ